MKCTCVPRVLRNDSLAIWQGQGSLGHTGEELPQALGRPVRRMMSVRSATARRTMRIAGCEDGGNVSAICQLIAGSLTAESEPKTAGHHRPGQRNRNSLNLKPFFGSAVDQFGDRAKIAGPTRQPCGPVKRDIHDTLVAQVFHYAVGKRKRGAVAPPSIDHSDVCRNQAWSAITRLVSRDTRREARR